MAYGFTGNVAADPHWLILPAGAVENALEIKNPYPYIRSNLLK